MKRATVFGTACLAALSHGAGLTAHAQESVSKTDGSTASPTSSAGVQVFAGDYFAVYNPVTAADMVARVPGFSVDDGDDRRGFGATAGNVLVNGERPSSKTAISDQLTRIPASAVLRVELISGSNSDVDVRGQSQLVNIVINRTEGSASPTTYVAEARAIQYSKKVGWTLQATRSFRLGNNADLAINLESPNLRGRSETDIVVRDANGNISATRDQYGHPNYIGLLGSARLAWRPTGRDTINANIEYAPTWDTQNIRSVSFTPTGTPTSVLYGRTEWENNYELEAGADWERKLNDALSVKLIGLVAVSGYEQTDQFTLSIPARPQSLRDQFGMFESGERVGRGVVTWRANDAHTLELGVEGAFNYLDTSLNIEIDGLPTNLAGSTTRVEEVRGEAFITDVWRASDKLTLETGFTFEGSRITQSGDTEKEREFTYPKPRINATYQIGPGNQLRAGYERDVSQLDFDDFASSVAVIDDIITLGNPELEPEKTWRASAEWDRRFGDHAALNLSIFHEQVEDVLDLIPLIVESCSTGGPVTACAPANIDQSYLDASGNIGDGTRIGLEVEGTLALDFIGLSNAELRFAGGVFDTSVNDPLTNQDRRFRLEEDWEYSIAFRQELPERKLAWGLEAAQESYTEQFKHTEADRLLRNGDHIHGFIETTALDGITLRLSVRNVTSPTETEIRTFYDPTRGSGIITGTETRDREGGPYGTRVIALRASGSF